MMKMMMTEEREILEVKNNLWKLLNHSQHALALTVLLELTAKNQPESSQCAKVIHHHQAPTQLIADLFQNAMAPTELQEMTAYQNKV
jgi:hypothetical protein